jgi:excisionase family DNA binding protein
MGSPDLTGVAALLERLAQLPERIGALESQSAQLAELLDALRAALPPALVSVADAARVWGVSVPTMRRWVREGRIATIKVENTVRVDLARLRGIDDLEAARLARKARTRRPLQD